ncbi:MAG: hypothetical protein F9K29_00350 [Hyphomicrobiaceae bacterium]|nr:MAG: hypothetical protein F9K29_00350 [Hyphomicrobiaceae bacterium]
MTPFKKGLGASIAALAVVMFAHAATAQEKKTTTTAPSAPAKTDKKVKAKSACNAITEEAACKADATCSWIAALVDSKTGKQKRKAYCKTKPKPPKKKESTKK